jgi:Do/DeqQ family serine protease
MGIPYFGFPQAFRKIPETVLTQEIIAHMNKRTFIVGIVLGSVVSALTILFTLPLIFDYNKETMTLQEMQSVSLTSFDPEERAIVPEGLNFTKAAKEVTPAVVYIEVSSSGRRTNIWEQFFDIPENEARGGGSRNGPFASKGSGVILTPDGFIATNFHVINKAERITVTLSDNRTYPAKIIGTDPQTDLALIKIAENNLPFVPFGDSDEVQIGDWVVAVGNPFELNSTVTAGIVSAKGRNIDILRESNLSVESFIQTDAVVNPGNSGGALVDLNGRLVGINTAIATRTGAYSGYSFAVPVSLVQKVMEDLKEFGRVQRGILGVVIRDLNAELAAARRLPIVQGVMIDQVNPGSGASSAGLLRNDIITAVEDVPTNNISALQERVARHRPGTTLKVTVFREGSYMDLPVQLRHSDGTTAPRRLDAPEMELLMKIELENVSNEEADVLEIQGGAKVISLDNTIWQEAGVQPGFIITYVGERRVTNITDFENHIRRYDFGSEVVIIGLYPDGTKSFYTLEW